jgi:hypothetical protein
MLFPVSFASVNLPEVAVSVSRNETATAILSLSDLRERISGKTNNQNIEDQSGIFTKSRPLYAKVTSKSVLFDLVDTGLVKTTEAVEVGTWVRTGGQVVEPNGRRWIKILLPGPFGEHNPAFSPSGYIPLDNISDRIALAR